MRKKRGNMMALALMSIGEKRTVQTLRGKDETLRHLQDLGFAPGAEVECVGETPGGMILIVKGVRIALDRGLASKIMVAGRKTTIRKGEQNADVKRSGCWKDCFRSKTPWRGRCKTPDHGYGNHQGNTDLCS